MHRVADGRSRRRRFLLPVASASQRSVADADGADGRIAEVGRVVGLGVSSDRAVIPLAMVR